MKQTSCPCCTSANPICGVLHIITTQLDYTRENITEFCLTREINLIFNKTALNIPY